MATSGTIQGTTKDSSGTNITGKYSTWISWTRNSYSIANNTSNVTVSVSVQRIDGYTGETVWDLITKPTVSLNVGGTARTATTSYIDTRNKKVSTFATWTGNVSHNANGTLNLGITCSWSLPSTYLASGYISGTAALDTIPRASTISAVSGTTIGSNCTVTITRADSSFTHTLWYKVGESDWYEIGTGIGTSKTFNIDLATANQFPNSMTGNMQLCVRTFSGTTQVGSDYYKDVTVSVPDYTMTGTLSLTGQSLLSGVYVQGKSKVLVSVDNITSYYGAGFKSATSTLDGKTYNGVLFTSDVLSSGSKTVSTTITDTRGKQVTLTSSAFTVYAYSVPTITEFTLTRQSDGTTVNTVVKGSVASVNSKNTKTIQVTLNGVTKTISSSSYTINGTTTFTGVPTDNTLTGFAKITDSYTSVTKDYVLPTVAVTMDYLADGKGVAFGKVAEVSNLLDVAWGLRVNGNINGVNISPDSYINGGVKENLTNEDLLASEPTYIGSYSNNGVWYNTISVRHRNGVGDGTSYGLQIRNRMTEEDGITYRQNFNGTWTDWKIILDTENIADYVVETGTSGIWTYRKWNSGIAECWGIYTMASSCTLAWGSLYYSNKTCSRINYPFTFKSRPQETVSLRLDSYCGWPYADSEGNGMNTTTQTAVYGFLRPSTMGETTIRYEFTVIGRWK